MEKYDKKEPIEGLKDKKSDEKIINFESEQNLIGFFNLLLLIDKRMNPQNYKNKEENNN